MKIKSKRVIRVVVCLILSTLVLACSFSVFADDATNDELTFEEWYQQYAIDANDIDGMWHETGIYGVWLTLRGMGIKVSVDGVEEWTTAMYHTMEELLNTFVETTLHYSYVRWIIPWVFGWTDAGLFQANNAFLDDVEDFADYLRQTYNLQDNSQATLSAYYFIPVLNDQSIPMNIPIYMQFYNSNGWMPGILEDVDIFNQYDGFIANRVYKLTSGYYVRFYDNGQTVTMQISGNEEFTTLVTSSVIVDSSLYLNYNRNYSNRPQANSQYNGHQEFPIFMNTTSGVSSDYQVKLFYSAYYVASWNQTYFQGQKNITQYELEHYFLPQDFSTNINTGVIILPSQDPEYSEGDGVIITPDGNDYTHVIIENPIEVKNLPAVIQITSIENPEIDQFYDFIPSFIEEAGDSMNFFKQIIFRMPDEVLYCIYAVLATGVIFGFLRILREH